MTFLCRQIICILLLVLLTCLAVAVYAVPVVSNVTARQRTDGSKIIDIYYDLAYSGTDLLTISVCVSNDGGSMYTISPYSVSGDVGANVAKGTGKHIIWNCARDLPGASGSNYKASVTASDFSNLWVPANADIYLAGQPADTVLSLTSAFGTYSQSDSIQGEPAFEVRGIYFVPGSWLVFSVMGSASNTSTPSNLGPDGDLANLKTYDPYSGQGFNNGCYIENSNPVPFAISGQNNVPLNSLIGVFTADSVPQFGTDSILPSALDYGLLGFDFISVEPQIRQIFFIGDGKTSKDEIQTFRVPQGATHLYLGINDGPGGYSGNSGGLSVTITLN